MDSIYFNDPLGLLIELASYRFEPPFGFDATSDVLLEAHKLRVERGDYAIAEEPSRRRDRDPRRALAPVPVGRPLAEGSLHVSHGGTMAANTLSILKPSVNNLSVRIFVRAAGLDFEEVDVWGHQGDPDFVAKDPSQLTPLLECEGLPQGALWESCAIMQYLCNKHGLDELYPTEPGERAMTDAAMCYHLATLYPLVARATYPALGFGQYAGEVATAPDASDEMKAQAAKDAAEALAKPLEVFRGFFLDGRPFIGGDRPSIADIRLAATLEFLARDRLRLSGLGDRVHGTDGGDPRRVLQRARRRRPRLHRVCEVAGWVRKTARKLLRVVPEAVQGFYADHCPLQAAGIAYRVLFSIVPLAIVLVSIFGLVLQNDEIRQNVVNSIVGYLPVSAAGRKDVEKALSSIATPASAAGLVSLVVFAWAASGMMTSLRQGLETAMHVVHARPTVRGKLVDLLLVVGAGALVLVTVLLTALGGLAEKYLTRAGGVGGGILAHTLARLLTLAILVGVVLLLYRFVPARGIGFKDGLAGAIVTSVLLVLISLASGFVYEAASSFSVIYGSLTVGLVFLYSVYLYSSALLLGAEVAASWARPEPTTPGDPVLTQVKRAVVGLFVAQKPE